MVVTLTPLEYTWAAFAGFMRQTANVIDGRKHAHGYKGDGYDVHVIGALAECVAAKAIRVYWPGPGEMRGPDVGDGYQVRGTAWATGKLVVHEEDVDDEPFILVTGSGLRHVVRGWLWGARV